MNKTDEAIELFKYAYGKTPKEAGFPVISIYEKQKVLLYAKSQEVIEAYKVQQNILRGILLWYPWPGVIAMVMFFITIVKTMDPVHPVCLASFVLLGMWVILFIVLDIKVKKTKRLVKMGETVTFLKY